MKKILILLSMNSINLFWTSNVISCKINITTYRRLNVPNKDYDSLNLVPSKVSLGNQVMSWLFTAYNNLNNKKISVNDKNPLYHDAKIIITSGGFNKKGIIYDNNWPPVTGLNYDIYLDVGKYNDYWKKGTWHIGLVPVSQRLDVPASNDDYSLDSKNTSLNLGQQITNDLIKYYNTNFDGVGTITSLGTGINLSASLNTQGKTIPLTESVQSNSLYYIKIQATSNAYYNNTVGNNVNIVVKSS